MRIYVGNLSYETTEDELKKDFSAFGEVVSVSVVTDRYSGRSKGFAFVEMTNKAEADAAIAGLNGKSVKDRTLVVNEARPRTEGGSGGGRSGGYSGVRRLWWRRLRRQARWRRAGWRRTRRPALLNPFTLEDSGCQESLK